MDSDITEVSHSEVGHDYRLKKITEIQMNLEEEIVRRRRLSENYYRTVTWVNNSDAVLIAVSMGLEIAGVGLPSTIVAAPVVVALEILSIFKVVLSIIGKYANKKLLLKVQKHEKITVLIEAKRNSISTLISKALNDGSISDRGFSLIMDEFSRFQEMKNVIKTKTREQIIQETRDSLIEQGRREAREQLKNQITLELLKIYIYILELILPETIEILAGNPAGVIV